MMQRSRASINFDGKIAGLYDLGDTLGRGHFAVVKLAKHVFTGEQVAVKVIDKTKLDDVSRAHLFQEVRCMKLVQHPNVVRLYEVIDTQTKLYLILELGDGGDMYDYIMKHEKGVDEETAKKYFRQIVNAISYCHKLHVVHRDLKPENVVFFEKLGMVKLTDFGFSNKFCPGQKLETSCGSLAYSAPEILLGDSYDAPKVDVWSLGVILYMLVCGHAPFQEANDSETLTMIMDCKYTVPAYVSMECKLLIQHMLIRDPEKRASLESIARDPWLSLGESPQLSDCLPLVSREHLLEEDHTLIIQKMVNGNIASKEEILEALDKNEYNHITATYFLLAERKLRAMRHEKAQLLNSGNRISRADLSPIAVTPGISSTVPSPAQEKVVITPAVDSLISPCLPAHPNEQQSILSPSFIPATPPITLELPSTTSLPLGRKCSIVREEEDALVSTTTSPTKSPMQDVGSRLSEQLAKIAEDAMLSDLHNGEGMSFLSAPCMSPPASRPKLSLPVTATKSSPLSVKPEKQSKSKAFPMPARRLHAVQSSPQLLLNEIHEEGDHTKLSLPLGATGHSSKKHTYLGKLHGHGSVVSHAMLRIMGQRHKHSKSRTASCSSSDASDEDGESLKRRIGKLKNNNSRDSDHNPDRSSGGNGGGSNDGNSGNGSPSFGGNSNSKGSDKDSGSSPGSSYHHQHQHQYHHHQQHYQHHHQQQNHHQQQQQQQQQTNDQQTNCDKCEKCLKNAHLSHVVFSTDSTDSLDLISEPQPRLVASVSCGDLAAEIGPASCENSISEYSPEGPVSSPNQSTTRDLHSSATVESIEASIGSPMEHSLSAKLRNKLSNSLSLNSGLSCLQSTSSRVSNESLPQQNKRPTVRLHISKLVPKSPTKQRLDINQNGWRKHGGSGQKSVMDVKLASKCCTLC